MGTNTSIDPNWVMAIVAIIAIVSPIITAIINNLYQSWLRKIELYEIAKRQAFIEYISASVNVVASKTPENEIAFYKSLNSLYAYFPNIAELKPEALIKPICYSDLIDYNHYSQELIVFLSKQIRKK